MRDTSSLLTSALATARRGTTLRWVARMLVVLSLCLSAAALVRLWQAETEDSLDDLEVSATERSAVLQREVERVEDQILSIAAFFGSSVEVTREEFASFTRPILRHHPEILALEWAELVASADREAYETRLAEFVGPSSRIIERTADATSVPAGERSSYVPVTFVEPPHGNEAVLGYDLASESVRADALDRAARSDEPTATSRVPLVQDGGATPGLLIVLPHVKAGRLRGYIVGVLEPGEILRAALGAYPANHLDTALLEVGPGADRLLGWLPEREGGESEALANLETAAAEGRVSSRDIHVGGRTWRLAVIASPEFIRSGRTWLPWLALALGLLTSCLVVGYAFLSVRHAEALTHEATHDPLSGLLNRRGLEQALGGLRAPPPLAALLVNFDDFAALNRSYGHGVGDVVLVELGTRVEEAAGAGCITGRIGGDEVLVLAPRTDAAEASVIAERIRRRISALPVLAMPRSVHVTASIGAAIIADVPPSLLQIVAEARTGLRTSKAQGKNRTAFGPEGGGFDEAEAKDGLRRICHEGDLRVIWEPLVRLVDEKVMGYELLIRGPVGEFEQPGELFRAATEQGLLTLLDMRCLRACVAAARGRVGPGDLHLNLLPSTLLDVPASTIVRILEQVPAPAGWRVCIEVNEQQFVSHPSYLLESINALRAAGVHIAIDDVGSGRGTLDSVLVLQPDIVKIDASLVRGASDDPSRSVPLGRLVRLCQSLDIEMVAEGVETATDRDFVRALGVGCGQGFFWSEPESKPKPVGAA